VLALLGLGSAWGGSAFDEVRPLRRAWARRGLVFAAAAVGVVVLRRPVDLRRLEVAGLRALTFVGSAGCPAWTFSGLSPSSALR